MANESTLSRDELDDRIAILRDNIRQLTEQAAAFSGAADEDRAAGRIAEQQAELDRLIALRDALAAKHAAASPPAAPGKKPAPKKAAAKKTAAKKKPSAKKGAKKKAAKAKPAKKKKKTAKAVTKKAKKKKKR